MSFGQTDTIDPAPERDRRLLRRCGPLAIAAGCALAALVTQFALGGVVAPVVTTNLFSLDGWLLDHAWTAPFLFLTFVWLIGARETGHPIYRVRTLVGFWVGWYVVRVVAFVGTTLALARFSLSPTARGVVVDLVALAAVCVLVFVLVRRTLREPSSAPQSTSGRLVPLWIACAAHALLFAVEASPCVSVDCRARAFRTSLDPEVASFLETYVRQSPVVREDAGLVTTVALAPRSRSTVDVWMDFDAKLVLEAAGPRGSGTLEIEIAGNDYRHIDQARAWWTTGARRVALDRTGQVDVAAMRFEATAAQEAALRRAIAADDCKAVLSIVDDNARAFREQTAYEISRRETALRRAECAERLGDTRRAAEAYAEHAYLSAPMPFAERSDDEARLRAARQSLDKAMAIDPGAEHARSWQLLMKRLTAQAQLAARPGDLERCLALKSALAENRVFYPNACTEARVPQ